MRNHRWVRGDWQLIPWLRRTVKDRGGNTKENPLSALTKWKIVDNLRRSLVPPSLMILIILSLSILPGNPAFWMGIAALGMFFPLLTAGIDFIASRRLGTIVLRKYIPRISGIKATLLQLVLQFILLPYNAFLMVNAIGVTLIRVFITKRIC